MANYDSRSSLPALKVGNSLVDAFTLQYYEGFPKDQVAWGEIASDI
jgi:glucose-1-phosphatase